MTEDEYREWRDKRIVELKGQGLTNAIIAERVGCSQTKVRDTLKKADS